jgi:hypothetical protein
LTFPNHKFSGESRLRLSLYPKSVIIPGDERLGRDNIGLKWRFIKIGGIKISGGGLERLAEQRLAIGSFVLLL